MTQLYLNDTKDKFAVLISPFYGSGWSTWNKHCDNMAFDKRIVEKFIELKKEYQYNYWDDDCVSFGATKYKDRDIFEMELFKMLRFLDYFYLKEDIISTFKIGVNHVCVSGYAHLKIIWVDINVNFTIIEHDGYEKLIVVYD